MTEPAPVATISPDAISLASPVVGDVVHYWPAEHKDVAQPYAAIVCYVYNDRLVNLVVFMSNGIAVERQHVVLLQEGDVRPLSGAMSFAEWPQDNDDEGETT